MVDLAQFEARLASARRHQHVALAQCHACCGELDAALQRYRGDFVDGLMVDKELLRDLRQWHMLLVLDNFEHLLPDTATENVDVIDLILSLVGQTDHIDRRGEAASLGNLGVILHQRGALAQARIFLDQALTLLEHIEDGSSVGRRLTYLGNLARDQEDWQAAEAYLTRACHTLHLVRDRHHEADARLALARLYRHMGRGSSASPCLERALNLYRQIENRAGEAEVLTLWGE